MNKTLFYRLQKSQTSLLREQWQRLPHEENGSLSSRCHPEGTALSFMDGTKARQVNVSGDLESPGTGVFAALELSGTALEALGAASPKWSPDPAVPSRASVLLTKNTHEWRPQSSVGCTVIQTFLSELEMCDVVFRSHTQERGMFDITIFKALGHDFTFHHEKSPKRCRQRNIHGVEIDFHLLWGFWGTKHQTS